VAAIEQLPGVQSAGAISRLPYRDVDANSNVRYEGQPNIDPNRFPVIDDRDATPDIFRVHRSAPVGGTIAAVGRRRPARSTDRGSWRMKHSCAVIFQHDDPVGKRFYVSDTTARPRSSVW